MLRRKGKGGYSEHEERMKNREGWRVRRKMRGEDKMEEGGREGGREEKEDRRGE